MLRRIKSAIDHQFLTIEEVFGAARRGDLAAIKVFVKDIELEVKCIKEEYVRENEQRMKRGLPRSYHYDRSINLEYTMNSVAANSDLWCGIYKCAARYKHIDIMNFLHSSSFILFYKMSKGDFDRLLDGLSPNIQEFILNAFVQVKDITIDDDVVIENKSSQQTANSDLQNAGQVNSIINSNFFPLAEKSDAPPDKTIIPSLPNSEDSTIFHFPSIVPKDKGEANEIAPDIRSSSSTMEPVVSSSSPSTTNHLQSAVQTKVWETLIQSLPNDYVNSKGNTNTLDQDIELLQYQVSQIQASLASQQELTHELRKQKMLMEQLDYIANGDVIVLAYFMQLKSRLTDYFIASRIISSGMVERAPYLLTDKLKKLLGDFSSLLTGVAHFATFASSEAAKTATELLKSLGDGLHIGGFMKELLPSSLSELLISLIESEEHCIERVAVISSGKNYTLSGLEYTADVIALTLTYIYRPQITCLTEEGAKLLAQCSAERVMILGKEGIVNRSNEWIPVVIALIGQPTMKQTKFFREINIPTKPGYQGRWTENGIHCESGIMCLQKGGVMYYVSGQTRHKQYGFRVNGLSIAERLYGMKVLTNDQVSEHVKITSSQYFSSNVSHSPMVAAKTSCDDVQPSKGVSFIPTSFTAASDPTSSLYILRKLQELQSQVARVESENRKLRGENAELKDHIVSMESNVTSLSKRQHEHQGKFENLRNTGVDLDRPLDDGCILLQSRDFSQANARGAFFLTQQTQIISRLGELELEVAAQRDARKSQGNK